MGCWKSVAGSAVRIPVDDDERLAVLRSYEVLDTVAEPDFSKLTAMLQKGCQVDFSAISFVDRHRQWFKAKSGFEDVETPREVSFCAVSMLESDPLIVENALLDPRFRDNPLVTGSMHVRFYAGFPLFSGEGFGLGAVCVFGTEARTLMPRQVNMLATARDWVQARLELRRLCRRSAVSASVGGEKERAEPALIRTFVEERAKRTWSQLDGVWLDAVRSTLFKAV